MAPPRRIPGSRQPAAPRAPRREGDRTTLRVPDDLAQSIERYAEEHRTSTNDALVRLAYAGASAYERERKIAELARVRGEAIMRMDGVPDVPEETEMISGEAMADIVLAWRRGLVD